MINKKTYKSGETVINSGIYEIVGPKGGQTKHSNVTCVEGEPFPPAPEAGLEFKLKIETNP